MMKYGFGRHLWEVTLVQLESYLNVGAQRLLILLGLFLTHLIA